MADDNQWDDPDFDDEGEVDVEWYPIPPGLVEAWEELVAAGSDRARKARARHAETGFGHRDNLRPGMRLILRKGDCRQDCETEVAVLHDGKFGWNGDEYPNGNQLLKAITGRERHRLTVRRYFGLGGEKTPDLVQQLRDAFLGKAIVARRSGIVYLSGDLEGIGVPEAFMAGKESARLTEEAATNLLSILQGANNE
jgi:hypothetical protein